MGSFDNCDRWIHQVCVENAENTNFSGNFLCKFCESIDQSIHPKKLKFHDNGLVNDVNYYKSLTRKYYIGFYSSADCEVKDITRKDFNILSSTAWLNNFITDICLHIMTRQKDVQLLTVTLSTQLLNFNTYIMPYTHLN